MRGTEKAFLLKVYFCSGQEAALDAWCERTGGISLRCNKGLSCVKLFLFLPRERDAVGLKCLEDRDISR